MKGRRITLAVGVAALALVAGACGSGDPGGGGNDFQVLVLGGLSAEGVLADNSATSVLAAKAGVAEVNATGGIDGRHVSIKVIDDQGDPTRAVTKLRQAIAQDKPDLVMDSGPSTISSAVIPILNQNDILSFNISPFEGSSDASKFPLNFDNSQTPQEQIKPYIGYLKGKHYRSVGILTGSTAYGQEFGKVLASMMKDAGFDVVAQQSYDVSSLDMTPQLSAIQSKKPDVLLLDAYGAPLGYVLQGVRKLGWDVPIVGDTSVGATSLVSSPPPAGIVGTPKAKNLVMEVLRSQVYDPSATRTNHAVKQMLKLGQIKASVIMAANYDPPLLVQAAAKHAGSTDAHDLAKALESREVQDSAKVAMLSHYHFTAEEHTPHVKSSEYVFIPPSELKDGQFH